MNTQQLKERIAECYDPDVLVDLLNIESEELIERFMDKVLERIEEFGDVVHLESERLGILDDQDKIDSRTRD